MNSETTVLVTGATGYIGGRLIPRLLQEGYTVRCTARDPERLRNRDWQDHVEVVKADALDKNSLLTALRGVDAAYYLIHSLRAGEEEFAKRDRLAASNFVAAAAECGVSRIVYLGGIKPKGERTSDHLDSRLETGRILREGPVPVTEFRAGVIVGSGSLSFELIRYLTERIPILVTPKWVRTPTQPIAVRDVLAYLIRALTVPESIGKVIEIGGKDILTFGDMFKIYARVRGLRRFMINVPVLTPRFSSHWVGLVTPFDNAIARPLIGGLDNEVVVTDETANTIFDISPISYEAAVRLALDRSEAGTVETTWSCALSSGPTETQKYELLEEKEGLMRERITIRANARPETVFSVIRSLGGDNGWLYANALWKIRGLMDLLVGGIGLRKTRRSYGDIREGDTIDFWRVEAVEDDRLLRLRAEMKVPGKAWLQYELELAPGNSTYVTQTGIFEPMGLWGLSYWKLFYLPHRFIFPGMLRELRRRAEILEDAPTTQVSAIA